MPSRTRARKSVDDGVPDDGSDQVTQPDSGEAKSRPAKSHAHIDGKKSPNSNQKRRDEDVQLFAFDADQGVTESMIGGRPKRKLKAIVRFGTTSFDKASNCKVGEGFPCPRCSAVCSYDSRECEECQLECYYEAGIGVVVLKERRVRVKHDTHSGNASQDKFSKGGYAASVAEHARICNVASGTSTTQAETVQRKEKSQSSIQGEIVSQIDNMDGNKKMRSNPQVRVSSSYPTDENDAHIPSKPAEGFPKGWVCRRIPRSTGSRKDPYFYSPKKRYKFRSKVDVHHFLELLEKAKGDESAAILLFKQNFGKRKRSSACEAIPNINNIASVDEAATTLAELEKDTEGGSLQRGKKLATEAQLPAMQKSPLKLSASKEAADNIRASKKNLASASMPDQSGEGNLSPKRKVSSAERQGCAPLSVRVQLYENELQPGEACAMESCRKMSAQEMGANATPDPHEKQREAMDSNSLLQEEVSALRKTNNEMTILLRGREAALREAHTTIVTLRQQASSTFDDTQQMEPSLENSLETEQLAVQDLEHQLEDAENDIVRLTQENNNLNEMNESLQSNLTDVACQKEKQSTDVQIAVKSLQTVTREKSDLANQLSELQARHDSALSDSAVVEMEHRETISTLEATIEEMKTSSVQVSERLSVVIGERDAFAKKIEVATADLSALQEKVSTDSSMIEKLRSGMAKLISQRCTAEKRIADLTLETKCLKETIEAMQSEKDELMMRLDGVNAKLGTLKLENEVLQNKSGTVCTEKQKEIEALKQQASKRMSQVYELTDQLSTALNEKGELATKLESSVAELSKMRDESKSQMNRQLESSVSSLPTQCDAAKEDTFSRLEVENAEALAKSKSLSKTVDELQGQIERLSAELNASKSESNALKCQITTSNAKCEKIEATHKECLCELERVINEKDRSPPDAEANYKKIINQQNDELQTLNEAISASDAQTADLIAQLSVLTAERDEMKAKAAKGGEEVSQSKSYTEDHGIGAKYLPGVIGSEKDLSIISADKKALIDKVGFFVTKLESEMNSAELRINETKTKLARACPNQNGLNGINMPHSEMKEALSQVETLNKKLSEEDAGLSMLISDLESLEARIKKALKKFKEKHLLTTKECKAKLKQQHNKIQRLKSDIKNIRANQKEKQSISYTDKHQTSEVLPGSAASAAGRTESKCDSIMVINSLKDDMNESPEGPLFAFDVTQEEYNWGRPKRKLKAITRFESMSFDSKKAHCKIGEGFPCPRCTAVCSYDSKECDECHLNCYYEAGIGVVVLKERKVEAQQNSQSYHPIARDAGQQHQSKFVLCHCPNCNKQDLTMKRLLSHYSKDHGGTLPIKAVKYSCPFCPSTTRDYKSLPEVEAHVSDCHPGRRLLKPSTSKKRQEHQAGMKDEQIAANMEAPALKKGPPSLAWTKLEFHKLLPEGGNCGLPRAIEIIGSRCKQQEEIVEVAQGQWKDEVEAKALDEERLLYKRGIRERSRMADQERLEKLRFAEKTEEIMIRYEHEGGRKRRSNEDIETAKLCSRQIVFSERCGSPFGEDAGACMNNDCQLCKKDSIYRQQLLLESEMDEYKLGETFTESPLIQNTANVLNPAYRRIDDDYFRHADTNGKNEDPEENSNMKHLRDEEDKLDKLKMAKHRLEFIKRYNDGNLVNAWGAMKKDSLSRKSF